MDRTVIERIERAQGCLLGQLSGDSLGSLVEFLHPDQIRLRHPDGLSDLEDGGTWDTLAGQPTDDSELALSLARLLVKSQGYAPEAARLEYQHWLRSGPFDCGNTIRAGLIGTPNHESQANGALMRVSPLGIYGARFSTEQAATWAIEDARITHPHPVCIQVNALFVAALAEAIRSGTSREELYVRVRTWADAWSVDSTVLQAILMAEQGPPADFMTHQGWVLVAFQNALHQLLHAPTLKAAVVETAMSGGDADTNAAICGALLGAVFGRKHVPTQWERAVLSCRPVNGREGVEQPRPVAFWPIDALELAAELVTGLR